MKMTNNMAFIKKQPWIEIRILKKWLKIIHISHLYQNYYVITENIVCLVFLRYCFCSIKLKPKFF